MKYEVYGQYSCEPVSISQEQMEYLAEKIVSNIKLTISDRKLIYTALTGDPEPSSLFQNRRGPKSKNKRDRELAEDHEQMKLQGIKLKEIREELCKKYKIQSVDGSTSAYDKALNKGKKELAFEREKQHKRLARLEHFKTLKK